MNYLGIDYGKKKFGLALATGPLADPYRVIRFGSESEVIEKLINIAKEERVDCFVVGYSERDIARESFAFAQKLRTETGKEVVMADETLTTHDANELAIEAGMKRSKRRRLEDALSAALILQSYLDIQT